MSLVKPETKDTLQVLLLVAALFSICLVWSIGIVYVVEKLMLFDLITGNAK